MASETINKWIIGIVLVIVAIIVAFTFVGDSSKELTDAADSITDANNCSLGRGTDGTKNFFNSSDGLCYNSTGSIPDGLKEFDLPLNSLFGSSGVVLLVMMAALLLLFIAISLSVMKKKKQ